MYTPTHLQTSLFGATSNIYIPEFHSSIKITQPEAINLLIELTQAGYTLTNPEYLFTCSHETLNDIKTQLFPILNSQTLEAYKLRDSFGKSVDLERYTPEEWIVIFAQYSLTYGWNNLYKTITNQSAQEVLVAYKDTYDFSTLVEVQTSKPKEITIINTLDLIVYIKTIMEAKIPLRNHQMQILKEVPTPILKQKVKFNIQATEAFINNLLYARGEVPNLPTLNSLMRFILLNGQKGTNNEDYSLQILKSQLKTFKFHLPTKLKKLIWNWLNTQNPKTVVEQMFTYQQWWKRCLHHAQWCSSTKFNKRYPTSKEILNLLYSSDKSWTFNSRYSTALQSNNYEDAIQILSEKPGLLFRNLLMFCRYVKGVKLPVKAQTNDSNTMNPFNKQNTTELLFDSKTPTVKTVEYDAIPWLTTNLYQFLQSTNPTIKTLWQLLEELVNKRHETLISTRYVQGQKIEYSTPIPAINKEVRDFVVETIKEYITSTKQEANASLGKIYLDPSLSDIAIQYSGATSSELSCSGSFLTQGSSIKFPSTAKFIRLGCAWKNIGEGSADIDLSTITYDSLSQRHYCYYRTPQLNIGRNLIAVSSGDVTSCSPNIYSAEFIDIDINLAKRHGLQHFINYLHVYSGKTLDKYDTHLFISFIKAEDRIIPGNRLKIDLAKQDYAIKLTDPATSYIGALLDLTNDTCKILNISSKEEPQGNNIINSYEKLHTLLQNLPDRLKMLSVLQHCIKSNQLVQTPEEADITIGTSTSNTINITTNMEKVNELIF